MEQRMTGLMREEKYTQVLDIFNTAADVGVKPTYSMFEIALRASSSISLNGHGTIALFFRMKETGYQPSPVLLSAMLSGFGRDGFAQGVHLVTRELKTAAMDISDRMWQQLAFAYLNIDCTDSALKILEMFRAAGSAGAGGAAGSAGGAGGGMADSAGDLADSSADAAMDGGEAGMAESRAAGGGSGSLSSAAWGSEEDSSNAAAESILRHMLDRLALVMHRSPSQYVSRNRRVMEHLLASETAGAGELRLFLRALLFNSIK